MEQLQPALGPPGMREQAAHQDFYGNLLLETAASAAAAKGLPAAGAAAAAAAAAAAPRPLPTPRRRTRIASPRATRTVACRGLQAGERSRGGAWGWGGGAEVSGLRMGAGAAGRRCRCPGSWTGSSAAPESAGLPPAVVTRWLPASAASRAGSASLSVRVHRPLAQVAISLPQSPASAPREPCRLSLGCFLNSCRGTALRERSGYHSLCSIYPWGSCR